MSTIPSGMVEVSQGRFFELLKADKRDIMPVHDRRDYTTWETRSRERWGWTMPGWANPGAPKVYAVVKTATVAKVLA